MQRFVDQRIPLTVCPNANVRINPDVCPTLAQRVFGRMRAARLLATLNTDDPSLTALELATGKGLGYQMLKAQSTFDYGGVWAAVAVLTFTSLVLYALVGLIETPVIAISEPDRLNE